MSSIRYEKKSRDIQIRAVAALRKLRWCLSLARRSLGMRPLRGRVVPGHSGPGSRLRPAVRRHSDGRGFTVTAAHPESDFWRVDLLSARWGRRGRGLRCYWEWVEKVAQELGERLQRERDRYREALVFIADTDPIDAALDPDRALRVARRALDG